jgi:hypothetical protein
MPKGVNDIPKIYNPIELKDYRTIRLCNVLYKVVSKCLVNRLQSLLGDIISENQSGFILGWMITHMPSWLLSACIIWNMVLLLILPIVLTNLICLNPMTELIGNYWRVQ